MDTSCMSFQFHVQYFMEKLNHCSHCSFISILFMQNFISSPFPRNTLSYSSVLQDRPTVFHQKLAKSSAFYLFLSLKIFIVFLQEGGFQHKMKDKVEIVCCYDTSSLMCLHVATLILVFTHRHHPLCTFLTSLHVSAHKHIGKKKVVG